MKLLSFESLQTGNWQRLLAPDDNADVQSALTQRNMRRCQYACAALAVIEPAGLLFLLAGTPQADFGWYALPPAALVLLCLLAGGCGSLRRHTALSPQAQARGVFCCFLLLSLILSACLVGQTLACGSRGFTYVLALAALGILPLLRPWQTVLLLLPPVLSACCLWEVRHLAEPLLLAAAMAGLGLLLTWGTRSAERRMQTLETQLQTFADLNQTHKKELCYQQDIARLQQELENSRIKAMINQMQPHFLYNALSAIRTITKRDPARAYDLLYDFTVHLRASIKALSSDVPIAFAEELKNVRAYLNIEKMRFGDELNVRYEIGCDSFYIVPLSIQPLVENATRHGIRPRGVEGGTVTLRTVESADAYLIEVQDDGVGFDASEVFSGSSDSFGLKNLEFRLRTLMRSSIQIDSRIGQGTLVTVRVPKEYGYIQYLPEED